MTGTTSAALACARARAPGWLAMHGLLRGLVWLAMLPSLAHAVPAHVRVKSTEQGQGFLFRRADTCYLVTADHVVRDARTANLVASGVSNRLGEAHLVARFAAQDLALLRVAGPLAQDCGDEFELYRTDLGRLLNNRDAATLPLVYDPAQGGADGGMSRIPLVVVDVGPEQLRVAPTRPDEGAMQGVSGALILVAGRPAGLIQTVDGDEAKVLRLDRAMQTLAAFFDNPRALAPAAMTARPPTDAAAAAPAAERGNLLTAAAGASVLRWSHEPRSAQQLTSNLIDPSATASWCTVAAGWPVEVDFRLASGQAVTIGRLEFVRADDLPAAQAAREVEVLVSNDGRSWLAIHLGTLFSDQPAKQVDLAPVRATYLRLRIYQNWGDDLQVGLRRLRAFAE